jgi:ABC-2 type transport system permease protein
MTFSWARALIVARREYLAAVRRKAFLVNLIIVPLYFGGVMALASRGEESGRRDTLRALTNLGVVDSSGLYAGATRLIVTRTATDPTRAPESFETYRTLIRFYPDQASLEEALRSGQTPQGLVIPANYLETGQLRRFARSNNLFGSASVRPIERWLARNLLSGRVDSVHAERASRPSVAMNLYTLGKDGRFEMRDDRREMLDFMVPFMVSILLAMCILAGGQYLLQGLSEEKESRILESLLCTLSTEDLLAGKLLGLGAAGFTLVAAWTITGLALGSPLMTMAHFRLPPELLGFAVAYFLLGYLFYGSLMTGIGAITNNMREAQQFSMMFSFANFVPFILMTSLMAHPDGALAVVLSLFPPTAPTTMMFRLGMSSANVPWWQLGSSLALLAGSGWLVLRGSARVFRIGLLMYGKTPSLPEILRWARSGR